MRDDVLIYGKLPWVAGWLCLSFCVSASLNCTRAKSAILDFELSFNCTQVNRPRRHSFGKIGMYASLRILLKSRTAVQQTKCLTNVGYYEYIQE